MRGGEHRAARADASRSTAPPTPERAWDSWKVEIQPQVLEIIGHDGAIWSAMREFASELPEVAAVGMILADEDSISKNVRSRVRTKVLLHRIKRREVLVATRSTKKAELCGLIMERLSNEVQVVCAMKTGWRSALDEHDVLFTWKTVRDVIMQLGGLRCSAIFTENSQEHLPGVSC